MGEKNNRKIDCQPGLWRVTVSDLNHFTEEWGVRLTSRRIFFLSVAAFVLIVVIGVAVVAFTPVKVLLPGFIKSEQRISYERLLLRVDSLSAVSAIQNDYLENVMAIMSDSVNTQMPVLKRDTISQLTVDSILPTSDAERRFVKQYEQREKFNLSVLSPIAAEGMTFFVPVVGAKKSPNGEIGKGVSLVTPIAAPVSSVYRGSVVAEYYDTESGGITIIVQHPQDFMSIYSGLATSYVQKGDKVNAGGRLGVMSQKLHTLKFELWHNGTPLVPEDYIPL